MVDSDRRTHHGRMRVLLVQDVTPDHEATAVLEHAGHEVVRCTRPGQDAYPCRALEGSCPLDATVDVAVVVHDRSTTGIAPGSVGAICARRDGVPLVLAGNRANSPFATSAGAEAASIADIPAAIERAVAGADARAGYLVSRLTGRSTSVTRRGDTVRVSIGLDATEAQALRAHEAVRRLYPAARAVVVGRFIE